MSDSKKINWQLLFFIAVLLIATPSTYIIKQAPQSHSGIVALELAYTSEKADTILNSWKRPVKVYNLITDKYDVRYDLVNQAKTNTWIDFIFILSYGLLLLAYNKRINTDNSKKVSLFKWLIIVACCFDVIENIGMLLFLDGHSYPVMLFSVPATLKFLLLVGVFLFGLDGVQWIITQLKGFTRVVRNFFYIFRTSPLTIVSLVVMYFFIWASDQGQDILLIINDSWVGPIFLYMVVIILALMNWHFPKIFDRTIFDGLKTTDLFGKKPFNIQQYKDDQLDLPRLLGAITFLIPAFGMLNVLVIFGLGFRLDFYSSSAWMVITIFLIQRCFKKRYFQWIYGHGSSHIWFWIICGILFLVPFLCIPLNNHEPHDIIWLFAGLLAYGILFCLITANRRALAENHPFFRDDNTNRFIWRSVLFPILLFGFYFVCNALYCPGFPVRFFAFSVAMSAIITYYGLFTILTFYGKIIRINLSVILVVLMIGITFGTNNDFHYIDKQPTTKESPVKLDTYIEKWLTDRLSTEAVKDSFYTIYLVNTYGGGIRASTWTCLVINKLDSLSRSRDSTDLFQNHVLAYSGASGGTVGASILCANGFNQIRNPVLHNSDYTAFFGNDYLTAVITGLLGNDIWYSGLHISCGRDRSKVQEHLWQRYYSLHFANDSSYGKNIKELWDGTHTKVPLLFSNSTDVTFGRKAICAPVTLNDTDFIGATIITNNLIHADTTLKLSTAAFLSARFPYLSPAGAFNSEHNILDGGMVDNAGAETEMQLYRVLKRVINAHDTFRNHFKVYVISLKNSYKLEDSTNKLKAKNIAQVTAPISALTNVGCEGNTQKNEAINKAYFSHNDSDKLVAGYCLVQPMVQKLPVTIKHWFSSPYTDSAIVPLPLGWSISDLALARMEVSVDSLCGKDKLLYKIIFPKK